MEKTRYSVSATDFASDGVSANNTAQFTNENPDRDGYRNKSVAGRLSHEWDKNQEFGLSVYANEGKFNFDGGGGGTPTDVARGFAKQESYSLFSKNTFTDNWVSTINLSQSNARGGNQNISTDPAGYSYNARSNSKASLLQWQNQIALLPPALMPVAINLKQSTTRPTLTVVVVQACTRVCRERSTPISFRSMSGMTTLAAQAPIRPAFWAMVTCSRL
jgi:vitamin B12 transporter